MKSQRGFTLIEIIVSLMLVSILAAAAGFGLVEVAKSYHFAKENALMAQKAHIALQRITLELRHLSSVTSATATEVEIETPDGIRSIECYLNNILLNDGPNARAGELLLDKVSAFELNYWKSDGTPWKKGEDEDKDLFGIDVSLSLTRGDGVATDAFTTQITPRNNGNLNAPS